MSSARGKGLMLAGRLAVVMLMLLTYRLGNAFQGPVTHTTLDYRPVITVSGKTEQEVAKMLWDEFLRYYRNRDIPTALRLKAYRIGEITLGNTTADGFRFTVRYSVRASQANTVWCSANGSTNILGWTTGLRMIVNVIRDGDRFSVSGMGTGP